MYKKSQPLNLLTDLQTEYSKNTFSQRVITEWNNLPPEAITAKTVNFFEGVIDPLFWQNMVLYVSQRRLHAPVLKFH